MSKTARRKPALKLTRRQKKSRYARWCKERDGTYRLWRVMARSPVHGGADAIGYLVTDRAQVPWPMFYVPICGDAAQNAARAFARQPALKDRDAGLWKTWHVEDLRGSNVAVFPVALLGMVLYPLDFEGDWQPVGNFQAAIYERSALNPRGLTFTWLSAYALGGVLEDDRKPFAIPMTGSPITYPRRSFANRTREQVEASASGS